MATNPTLPSRYVAALTITATFCAVAVGYVGCMLGGLLPSAPRAWLVFAATASVIGGLAAMMLNATARASLRAAEIELHELRAQASTAESLQTEVSSRAEQQRRLRHDLRGALSPVMLIADRLVSHADPAVKRSGDILLRSVERATEMLTEPSPPAGP